MKMVFSQAFAPLFTWGEVIQNKDCRSFFGASLATLALASLNKTHESISRQQPIGI
jgi:hypothetical protein